MYTIRDEGRADVINYIEMFYSSQRRHGSNELLSPVEFEKRFPKRLASVWRIEGDSLLCMLTDQVLRSPIESAGVKSDVKRPRLNGSYRPRADLNAQTLVLSLEHPAYYIAVGWFFVHCLWVPLATCRVKEVAAVNMYPTRKSQQWIRD